MDKQLEQGFHIVMAGEKAIIGKDYHLLSDESSLSFVTEDPRAFRSFLTEEVDQDGVIITFDEGSIRATTAKAAYTNSPCVAFCKMLESPIIDLIRKCYSRKGIPAAEFETFLYTMRKYYGVDGKNLYDQVKHLTIKKVTSIEKVSDNQGNFHYCVSRTGDKKDMEPTPQITFRVPVLQNLEDQIEITFDVHLLYREIDGGVAIFYDLINPFFEEALKTEKREIIKNQLLDYNCLVLLGTLNLNQKTDEWRYKENGID